MVSRGRATREFPWPERSVFQATVARGPGPDELWFMSPFNDRLAQGELESWRLPLESPELLGVTPRGRLFVGSDRAQRLCEFECKPGGAAEVFALLSDRDNAMRWLKKLSKFYLGFEERVLGAPDFDSPRDDPEFIALTSPRGPTKRARKR